MAEIDDLAKLPPPKKHTDAALARLAARLFAGDKVTRDELQGLFPVMRGDEGPPNMKLEGAVLAWSWEVVHKASIGLPDVRPRLLRLLDHQLEVGMWSVPGPRGPISEFQPPSHSKHHLRWMADCLWAARKAQDEEVLARIRKIWMQVICWARLCATADGRALCAGPRATRRLNKEGEVDMKRIGTDVGLDATLQEVCFPEFRASLAALQGDDMLAPRMVRSMRDAGEPCLQASSYRGIEFTSLADLPRSLVRLIVARGRAGEVAVWIDGPCASSDPGCQWWARFLPDAPLRYAYGVEQANATPEIGFFPFAGSETHPRFGPCAQGWQTRPPAGVEQPPVEPPSLPRVAPPSPPVPTPAGLTPQELRELATTFEAGARRLREAADRLERP
jgi:hypothetical protein